MKRAIPGLVVGCLLVGCAAEEEAVDVAAAPAPGSILWTFDSGGEVWAPLRLDSDVLYFGSDNGLFTALDTETRAPLWEFAAGARIRSAAELAAGTVLFASDDGYLYALERESGEERWRFDLGSAGMERRGPAADPPFDYDYLHSSPVVEDGVVFVGSADANLYAIDLETGREIWRFAAREKIRSTPTVAAGTVFVGSWDGHLYAIATATGEELWSFDTEGPIQSTPAVEAGRVVVGSRAAKLIALDAETGELQWTHAYLDGSWIESSPVISEDVGYIGSSDALKLFAFDAGSGDELWQFETGGWTWSTPIVTEEAIYVGSISAYPYYFEGVDLKHGFYAIDGETGRELWRMRPDAIDGYVTGGVHSSAQVGGGVVYVGSLDGRIYALAE